MRSQIVQQAPPRLWVLTLVVLLITLALIVAHTAPARRTLIVGGDHAYPPYEYLSVNGQPQGFNVDLMRALGELLEFDIEFRLGAWNQARQDLVAGKIDILPMINSGGSSADLIFTEPYTIVYLEAYAHRDAYPIRDLDDLSGQEVIVRRGSFVHENLIQNHPDVKVMPVDDEPDALWLLDSGKGDYALVNQAVGLLTSRQDHLNAVHSVGPPLLPRGYALAVTQRNSALIEELNRGLEQLKASGRYTQISEHWFGGLISAPVSLQNFVKYILPLALLAALALLWSWLLKRQVKQQTRNLERELAERREIEQALRDSEAYFRDVTDAASDWRWETDELHRFKHLSERFFELTGIAPDKVLRRTRWQIAVDDTDAEKWQQHRETMEQQRPFRDFIYKPVMADQQGKQHHFKISGKPVYNDAGKFKGYRGMGTDITEQVEAETALRESQRTLATLMGNLPGMAYRCRNDRDWTMEVVSKGAIELIGYQPEDLVHNRKVAFADLIHPDDFDWVWQEVQEAVQNRRPFQATYRITTAGGAEKWVWEQGCGVFSPQGKLQALEGFIIDITEEKYAQQEMSRMRVYLKNIIDSMPSVLVVVDNEGIITEWNQAAEKMSGIAWQQAKGCFFVEVFPELRTQLDEVKRAILERRPGKTQRMTKEIQGVTHYLDVMVYPLTENTVGAVIRVDDVSAQVRIQEMMVQTEKMLSIGGLAAGMAHEINNPLGVILQSSQNILRRISPELVKNREIAEELGLDLAQLRQYLQRRDVLRFFDAIQEAGTRAAKIVSDMLTFSRRSELRFEYVDIKELLDTTMRLAASDYDLKKRYDFKQIHIEHDYDANLERVYCDKTEIEQVILNLVKNAAQAMADDGTPSPTITLTTRREPKFAVIEVRDNGPGMDDITRKRVFEPFFTTKEIGVGTGLGLSVSYFIIKEQHKGNLSVVSEPGKGACFRIRLPLTEELEQHADVSIGG